MWRICLVLVLWGCSRLFAQTLSPEVKEFVKVDAPIIALEHVRVIDGTGAAAKDDQTLVLANRKIRSVGGAAEADVPKDAQVLDLHGYSVIPGLVGMHDRMFYPMGNGVYGEMAYSFPRLYLAAGVTTIRTTGSLEPYTDLEIKRNIDSGETPGPKIHPTGPYIEGKGSWVLQAHKLTGPDDATKTVNFWLDQGVDNFKIYNFITADELAAAIKAAHKREPKSPGICARLDFAKQLRWGLMISNMACWWTRNSSLRKSRISAPTSRMKPCATARWTFSLARWTTCSLISSSTTLRSLRLCPFSRWMYPDVPQCKSECSIR